MLGSDSIRLRIAACVVLCSFVLNGCASIVGGGSSQGVYINAQPGHANYTIKSSSGLVMGSGSVPNQVRLPRKNEYQIDISVDGYKTQTVVLTKSLNGWVWGNLIIGWVVGFAIDFISGAAYKLEPALISVNLVIAQIDEGRNALYAIVALYDKRGNTLQEHRVEMEPVDTTPSGVVSLAH